MNRREFTSLALAGLGMHDTGFRLSRLLEPVDRKVSAGFKQWVDQAGAVAVRAAELTAARGAWRPGAKAGLGKALERSRPAADAAQGHG